MSSAAISEAVRTMGRPNKITLDAIVSAATDIGLENVTMARVADRLGVSVGALYRHVSNRSELQGLVAQAQFGRGIQPVDTGQHWSALLRAYAGLLFDLFAGNPALIAEYAGGGFPPTYEADMFEAYLSAMQHRGFDPDEALRLIQDLRAIAIGAAVVSSAMGWNGRNGTATAEIDSLLDERSAQLPILHAHRVRYRTTITDPGHSCTLETLIAAVAAQRGEVLPET